MGIDYSFHLAFGYRITEEDLGVLGTTTPEESVMEKRFDPKTGDRIADVKVVKRHKSTVFTLDGEEFDYEYQLIPELCSKLDCVYYQHTGGRRGAYILSVHLPDRGEEFSCGRVSASGECTLADLEGLKPEVERLGAELRKLGIQVDEPLVMIAAWVG